MSPSNYDYSRLTNRRLTEMGDFVREHNIKYENGILINQDAYEEIREDLDAWRYRHIRPMDDIFDAINQLKEKHPEFDYDVAERLKRLPSILGKLHRFPTMKLNQIQDIGGVRIICSDIDQLMALLPYLDEIFPEYKEKNRLENPAPSGYRGIHRIYKKDGVCVELQIRTMLEHVWATSVESIDVLRGTAMKNGEDGAAWTEFFQLLSSFFAMSEQLPVLEKHDGMTGLELVDKLKALEKTDRIISKIRGYAKTNNAINGLKHYPDSYYALIRRRGATTELTYYPESQVERAFTEYEQRERGDDETDKVLVSISNVEKISKIYPNYFVQLDKIAGTLGRL
ncbi:RelA/SpoT domain-containing protein, partial [Candidatus Saccharibacteria bacterium]|nr:RelA/SpoT domain-containing protein [Candidatus Saccharibacteria bacterium]